MQNLSFEVEDPAQPGTPQDWTLVFSWTQAAVRLSPADGALQISEGFEDWAGDYETEAGSFSLITIETFEDGWDNDAYDVDIGGTSATLTEAFEGGWDNDTYALSLAVTSAILAEAFEGGWGNDTYAVSLGASTQVLDEDFEARETRRIAIFNSTTDVWTTSAPHGLTVGDFVTFSNENGELPAGHSPGYRYAIISTPTPTTFQVSGTAGGTVINGTTSGVGTHYLLYDPEESWVVGDNEEILLASTDFSELANSLTTASVLRKVTAGVAKPPSSVSNLFVYALNSIQSITGAVGLYLDEVTSPPSAPTDPLTGGTIQAVMQRAPSAGDDGWSCYVFAGLQSADVNAGGYMLGLSDASPSRLVLRKASAIYSPAGLLVDGLPDLLPDPQENGILLTSTSTYDVGQYVHVRLDWLVRSNGDVILQCFENDLDANPIGDPPSWTTIPGMEGPLSGESSPITGFVDDAASINTGSAPYTSGFFGFGASFSAISRRAYFDGGVVVEVEA